MNTTPVWVLGFSVKGVLISYIDDGLYFQADDLKDAFVRHCVISIKTARPFFLTPSFVLGCRDLLRLRRPLKLMARPIIMELGVRAKWQLEKTMHAVLIAYYSKAAGIRILGGRITNTDEATTLTYGYDNVGVYRCNWGPRDNG